MISFENTEIAFKSKSNGALRKAYWLFKLVGNPLLVKFGKCATELAFKLRLPISGLIKKTIFSQFCGGVSINDCEATTKELGTFGVGTILDYSVEGKTSDEDFDATVEEIIATIHKGKDNPNVPFAVFKTSGIARFELLEVANNGIKQLNNAQTEEYNQVRMRLDKICLAAYQSDVSVFIDSEETWIQTTIDCLAFEMMEKYNKERAIIFNTFQMYRHDRMDFAKKCLEEVKEKGIKYGVKLVRGAYMEKERDRAKEKGYLSPIQPNKEATDKDFNLALDFIVENIEHFSLCAGTHNEFSSHYLTELLDKNNLLKTDKRIYFAQLLGMSDHISFNLAHCDYNVAKYVPYGPIKEVMPYLLRRADENTSVAGQTSRELSLIMREIKRRKGAK